jgi:hypothetical protein
MTTPFVPAQQPDASVGRRYAKAFKYVFAMLKAGEDLATVDPGESAATSTTLVDEGRFVVLTLPQQIQMRGPFATAVTVMQDGGKVVESRGQVLRPCVVTGTTGFLPPNTSPALLAQRGRLVQNAPDLDGQLGAVSGYLQFRKLRYLFDLYGDERRRGNIDVAMYFFDYKNDDFWRIEPQSFDPSRTSRSPMTSSYSVQFQCLERADALVTRSNEVGPLGGPALLFSGAARTATGNVGGVLAKVAGALSAASKSSILAAVSRFADMVTSGLDFLVHCDAVVQRAFQATLNRLDAVVGFFANAHDTFFTLLDTVPTLLAQLSGSLAGLFTTIDKFAPDNIRQEINAWELEVTTLTDHMAVQVGLLVASQPQRDTRDTDQRFAQGRMKAGATTDLMREPGSGPLDANPFVGTSGLSLVTDVDALAGNAQHVSVVVNQGDDVYSLARRVLGRVERFVDIVLINKLEFPFIVADAATKPPNTLAWGERALVPAPAGAVPGSVAGVGPASVPTASGTVDTGSPLSQLVDSTASWLPGQWVGYTVTAVTGGSRQSLICNANDATTLTVSGTWTIPITLGVTTYAVSYSQFDPGRPVTAETRAYGVDMLAVFDVDGRCDAAIGATGDLAVARGLDNFFQAITLRSRCPLGEHPFHRGYGTLAPVGRPFTDDVGVLYAFHFRRSQLSDPRVGRVRNIQISQDGDVFMASAEVQPVDARTAQPINVRVGA